MLLLPAAGGHRNRKIGAVRKDPPKNRGFTVIELLVVLAMIGVLSVLLLPVLSRGKGSAHAVICRNNLKQMGVALGSYVLDEGSYPTRAYVGESEGDIVAGWKLLLNRYLGPVFTRQQDGTDEPIDRLTCPTLDGRAEGDEVPEYGRLPAPGVGRQAYGYNSYGMTIPGNTSLSSSEALQEGELGLGGFYIPYAGGWQASGNSGWTQVDSRFRAVPESGVTTPADTLAFGDAYIGTSQGPAQTSSVLGMNDISLSELQKFGLGSLLKTANTRHNGRLNTTFCDGHVESLRLSDLFSRENEASLARWNRDHRAHKNLLR